MKKLSFSQLPVDAPVTWGFGEWDNSIRTGQPYQHRGIDYGCITGTPIYAPADGVSVDFINDGSYGNAICLRHEDGDRYLYSLYAHLVSVEVFIGDEPKAGQLIGYSGSTGLSTGPHLHWQLCTTRTFPVDIQYSLDPMLYYKKEEDMTREEVIELLKEFNLVDKEETVGDQNSVASLNEWIERHYHDTPSQDSGHTGKAKADD